MKTLHELASDYKLKASWIQARLSESHPDRIPHIKLGRYPRFDPESAEFKLWLAQHRVSGYDDAHESDDAMPKRSYQQGRVEKRKRKTRSYYVLRYRLRDGSRWIEKTEELEAANIRDARGEGDRRMLEVNQLNNVSSGKGKEISFELFIKTHWKHYAANLKPSTQYSYESMLDTWVIPSFTDLPLRSIEPVHITELLNKLERKALSPKYRLNVYGLLRVVFDVALEYNLIESSPVRRRLHRPCVTAKQEKPALTAEQVSVLLAHIPAEHRALFVLLSITILRIGELLALRWMNFDQLARTLSITHNLWRGQLVTPKTRASEKTFKLPRAVFAVLEAHRAACARSHAADFIFTRGDGRPLDPDLLREQVYYPALRAAGIELAPRSHGFHLLRHSGASILYQLTRDLKLVQSHARHAQVSTTSDIYVHLDSHVDDEAGEILAGAILPGRYLQ